MRLLIVMAMHAEADPVAAALNLGPTEPLDPNLPALSRRGSFAGAEIHLVINGVDQRFGVDSIGTVPAALTTWIAARAFAPDLILNAGTAGGFAKRGGHIGDIYLSQGPVVFHDRRIPLGAFEPYGRGSFPCIDATALAKTLSLKLGTFTSGDSLDLSEADANEIARSGAAVKDMESAAVAWTAQLLGIPFLGVRSITDIVDGPHSTGEEFMRNLDMAVTKLATTLPPLIAFLCELRASA